MSKARKTMLPTFMKTTKKPEKNVNPQLLLQYQRAKVTEQPTT